MAIVGSALWQAMNSSLVRQFEFAIVAMVVHVFCVSECSQSSPAELFSQQKTVGGGNMLLILTADSGWLCFFAKETVNV